MAESKEHMDLVRRIKDYVELLSEIEPNFIRSDLPEMYDKPPAMTEGFRPDLYYEYNHILIIGEAKTSLDFERVHSIQQYISYMKACNLYQGKAIFILAVPWTEYVAAKNMLRRMRKANNFLLQINVINNANKMEKI